MAFFTGNLFTDGQQVDSTDLNNITALLRLASDSADGTTVTISAGVLSVGVLSASNYGNGSVGTSAIADESVNQFKLAADAVTTAAIENLAVTNAKIADLTIAFGKLATAALATQAEMQSETASKLVAAATAKYHAGVSKAYGTVAWEGSLTTITGGYNVTSAAEVTPGTREITLAVTMANTNYVVFCTGNGGGSQFNVTGKTTTKFTIDGPAEASGRTVSFIVFGQLA